MIKIPETKLVETKLLTVDGKNPNKMNKAQREALKKNIEKYGFLIPIITNKDFLVADGEHRLKIAKELKLLKVPVVALQVKEVDRRILRQVMNKLRGTHDKFLDDEEYKFIFENNMFDEFKELLILGEKEEVRFLANPKQPEFDENISTEHECPKCGFKY